MTDPRTRHTRGLIVVILLALVFFALLALIVVRAGRHTTETTTATETLTVLPQRIRIRTAPHARAPVVATATNGERVKLLEDGGTWVRVETADGLSGWAERATLERTAEQQRRLAKSKVIRNLPPLKGITTDRTQLFAGPGIFYPVVGELGGEKDVVIYTRDHDFYAIEHSGAVAYASVDAVDVSASGTRQLNVETSSAGATTTEPTAATQTSEPPPIAETAFTPAPIPEPVPEPQREPAGGVYAAVPAGGTQPEELDRVIPRYPSQARRANAEGAVVVRGIVRRDGTIDNVEIIKDLPYGLGESARQAVSRWRFRPATFRGEAIDVYYTVTVNFRLQ